MPHEGKYLTDIIMGQRSLIEKHPNRKEIDYAILNRMLSDVEIMKKWGIPTASMVTRRRKSLYLAISQTRAKTTQASKRKERQVQELVNKPMKLAMDTAVLAKDAGKFAAVPNLLEQYYKGVEIIGQATGQLGGANTNNPNQSPQLVVQIMSLPRADDQAPPINVIDIPRGES